MLLCSVVVTVVFYFILDYFNTAYIVPSTISVTTSFIAVYLTFRRNPYFALAYASNDIVLIILWTLASIYEIRYVSVVVCFIAFFVNDIYGYISWEKMKKRQKIKLQAKAYIVQIQQDEPFPRIAGLRLIFIPEYSVLWLIRSGLLRDFLKNIVGRFQL